MAEKPCCAAAAARKIKQLNVNGIPVGLYQLDEVMDEVGSKGLPSEEEIGNALIKKIMVYNYVPPKMVQAYRTALLVEFSERMKQKIMALN